MVAAIQPLKRLNKQQQASYFHSRERRKSLSGYPELHRTHRFLGSSSMAVPTINTGVVFPDRGLPVTFRTIIRVTANATQHRGLMFEFGSATTGIAAWVGDQTIGLHAGDSGIANGALALFDNGAELPVGSLMDLMFAISPGNGKVKLWSNGKELASAVATNNSFTADWSDSAAGSFADAINGANTSDLPAISNGAPAGFEVIEPLSVYLGQLPRQFA